MKFAHSINVSVFCRPEDSEAEIKRALFSLFPFDLEKEKIKVAEQNASGFNERRIKITEIRVSKETHTNSFLKNLKKGLGEQCSRINHDAETRIDDEFNFFIRLDKEKLIKNNEFLLTDSGSCFHIRMDLAVFPKKRERAVALAREFFA